MSKMDYYYDLCKDCDYLYHCFGREVGEKIERQDIDDMYLQSGSCRSYVPLREQ